MTIFPLDLIAAGTFAANAASTAVDGAAEPPLLVFALPHAAIDSASATIAVAPTTARFPGVLRNIFA
jgi:hypothetical protein